MGHNICHSALYCKSICNVRIASYFLVAELLCYGGLYLLGMKNDHNAKETLCGTFFDFIFLSHVKEALFYTTINWEKPSCMTA